MLRRVSEYGHLEAVELLLQWDADINAQSGGRSREPALVAASANSYLKAVRLLLERVLMFMLDHLFHGKITLQASSECDHLNTVQLPLE